MWIVSTRWRRWWHLTLACSSPAVPIAALACPTVSIRGPKPLSGCWHVSYRSDDYSSLINIPSPDDLYTRGPLNSCRHIPGPKSVPPRRLGMTLPLLPPCRLTEEVCFELVSLR